MSLDNVIVSPMRTCGTSAKVKFAMLTTFPPTVCGIATFSAALSKGLSENSNEVAIVRVGADPFEERPQITAILDDESLAPSAEAIDALNRSDVAIIQHEYGLYAGADGESIVRVLEEITRPSIVVAHTVLGSPTLHQREILEAVTSIADVVVVMTQAGSKLLIGEYGVDPLKIEVIPHGAAVPPAWRPRPVSGSTRLLTWGLLGPGKGIEWAIDSLAELDDIDPQVSYRIAGDTHPKVKAVDGEAYREMLVSRAANNGVAESVEFDAGYRGLEDLANMIGQASVVILPYDSPDQVTSGVLVDAVAAGRPVIATAFPHSIELLASGAGLVVPQRDPHALALAIRRFITEPGLADAMTAEAQRLAPSLAWKTVAARYASLASELVEHREAALT